jgi:hypothetical protein
MSLTRLTCVAVLAIVLGCDPGESEPGRDRGIGSEAPVRELSPRAQCYLSVLESVEDPQAA